jgi:uncharacterized damage-inducible protein DinB
MHQLFSDYMKLLAELHADFEKTFEGLSVEALDWSPGKDMNSLCVLVVHVVGSARFWVGEVAAGIPANRDRDAEFRASGMDEATLKAKLAENLQFIHQTLEPLTPDSLAASRFLAARNQNVTASEAIMHALEHTALHVGHAQITRQLWDQRS